ncbi:MAG: DUF1573 domain-containing protein [Phycisphaerales bacterium]|nr:DUF1573 domain-containing protein [Phycisphaerales bacterium]MCI0676972.1 DUF1573 domain-containing protein [Phycisphaerales bacterium]
MMSHSGRVFGQSLFVALGSVLWSCSDHSDDDSRGRANPARSAIPAVVFDAGDIAIDSGAVTVERDFDVSNTSAVPVDLHCKTTCGCMSGTLSKDRLEPGESANLKLKVQVSHSGRRAESAWVTRSDGQAHQFVIKTNGTVVSEFRTFKLQGDVPPGRQFPIRAYLVDSGGDGVTDAPILVSPHGPRIVSSGWNTLERRDTRGNRPTRQVGTLVVDLSGVVGPYPLELKFRTTSGSESTVVVDEPGV